MASDFDLSRLAEQVLEPVSHQTSARYQKYDWPRDRMGDFVELPARELVIVEGVYSTISALRDYYHFRIWVECPHQQRLERGLLRDGEQARALWTDAWMPEEDRYVALEAPQAFAHIVAFAGNVQGVDPSHEVVVILGAPTNG